MLGIPQWAIGSIPHWTMVFNTFVMMQLFNQVVCQAGGARSIGEAATAISSNRTFVGIVGAELALQALLVQCGGQWFQTEPLSGQQWAVCVGFGALSLVVNAVLQRLPTPGWMHFGGSLGEEKAA